MDDDEGDDTVAIVLGVVLGLVLLGCIALLALFFLHKRRHADEVSRLSQRLEEQRAGATADKTDDTPGFGFDDAPRERRSGRERGSRRSRSRSRNRSRRSRSSNR